MFFIALVSTHSMDIHPEVDAFLGHHVGAHGTELRLRDPDDGAANLHETSAAFLTERCKFFFLAIWKFSWK